MIAIVAGATGMVGRQLVHQLLDNELFSEVKIFVRRSFGLKHSRLSEFVVNFDRPEEFATKVTGNILFLCMGTTLASAGSKENQFRVDYTYQFAMARMASTNGVETCILVSSVGARASSGNFYLSTKGKLDDAVRNCGFTYCCILRPGQLYGERVARRLGEIMALQVMFLLNKIGLLLKYRPIHAFEVSVVMIKLALRRTNCIVTLNELFEVLAA